MKIIEIKYRKLLNNPPTSLFKEPKTKIKVPLISKIRRMIGGSMFHQGLLRTAWFTPQAGFKATHKKLALSDELLDFRNKLH